MSIPDPPRAPISAGRTGETCRAHILDADEGIGGQNLQTRLEQELFHERVAHLHGRPFVRSPRIELRRRHRRAVDAVSASLGSHVVDRVSRRRPPLL